MRKLLTAFAAGAGAGLLTLAACGPSYESQMAEGAKLYERYCASCHGPDAAGTPWGGNLALKYQTKDYNEFAAHVLNGKQSFRDGQHHVMPSFAENEDVVAHLEEIYRFVNRQTWPPEKD